MSEWNRSGAAQGRDGEESPRGRRGGRAGGRGSRRVAPGDDAPRSAMPTSALSSKPRGGMRGRGARGASAGEDTEPEVLVPARVRAIEEHARKAGRYTVRLEALGDARRETHAERAASGTERASNRTALRSATVSADIVERLGLREGAVLQVPQVAALRDAAASLRTYDRALNLLASRARSSTELRRKLVEKGEPAALADRAIARLTELGLLNDEEYARQVARGRLLGGASKRRVQQELWRRGVARELADDAVAEVVADEEVDEEGAAVKVARRKAASLAKLDAPVRRRRLYAFLARRGYDHAAIRSAMARVLDAAEVDALDEEPMDDDAGDA